MHDLIKQLSGLHQCPEIAAWKLLLLNSGIDCTFDFLQFGDRVKTGFKLKYANKKITVQNNIFFDASNDLAMVPAEVILETANAKTLFKFNYNPDSRFQLHHLVNGRFDLMVKDTGEALPLKIFLVPINECFSKEIVFEDRTRNKISDFVQLIGMDRLGILFYKGCEHWLQGVNCKFCDSNPEKKTDMEKTLPSLNYLQNFGGYESWWDHFKVKYLTGISKSFQEIDTNFIPSPHRHLQFMAGNIQDLDFEWKIFFEIIEAVNSAAVLTKYDTYLNIMPPDEKNQAAYFVKAREKGIQNLVFNLEVIGEDLFNDICRGKKLLMPYEKIKASLKNAVKYFGFGNVRSNFVFGLQPAEELLKGIAELAEDGIVGDYSVFVPKKYTPLSAKQRTDIHSIMEFSLKLAEIYQNYNFKPLYCRFSSRSQIMGDMLLPETPINN